MVFFVFFVQLRNYRVVTVIIMRHARYSVPVFVDVDHLTLQYNIFQLGVSLGSAWGQLLQGVCSVMPLMSARESPEVSWEEKEVEAFTGESEVFGSEDPASDMEPEEEDSEAKSEVGETEQGVKP